MLEVTGIGGVILLALSVWAIISIVGSSESNGKKVLLSLFVLLLPLVGFIVTSFAGPFVVQCRVMKDLNDVPFCGRFFPSMWSY